MRHPLVHARVVEILNNPPGHQIMADNKAYGTVMNVEQTASDVIEAVLDYIIEQLPAPVGEVGE